MENKMNIFYIDSFTKQVKKILNPDNFTGIVIVICLLFFNLNIFSQGVGINATGAQPNSKALLDIDVSGQNPKAGLLIPRLTDAQRNTITAPIPESLLIFNSTCNCFQAYNADISQWINLGCLNCVFSGSVVATAATNVNQLNPSFSANWTALLGADTYYLDVSTVSDFSSFLSGYQNLNVGNVLTYTVTGLTCGGTVYYYRVRAENSCGFTSYSNTVSQATSSCWSCGNTFQITHIAGSVAPVTKTVTYGTVSTAITGTTKCWITQNLGADNQAATATTTTEAAAGWYWQFNKPQGYKYTTSRTPATAWITSIDEASDWTGANDPCTLFFGTGWRLPTETEWTNADGAPQNWESYSNTFSSVLKLHAAGYLLETTGAISSRGSSGRYWSSTQYNGTNSRVLSITSFSCNLSTVWNKAYAFSVRCLKD